MGNCVFGPVPSRRLGRSLGVDLVPFKTCTYNCVYCQLGATTDLTLERKSWIPTDTVVRDFQARLPLEGRADWVTFAGSGEPTLHEGIGEIITEVKKQTTVPVAVLTNGSLLWDDRVCSALLGADCVIPSLDAPNPALFRHINRPHIDLEYDRIFRGLVEFRKEFSGELRLEILLLAGLTGMDDEVRLLAERAAEVQPHVVQLTTVIRPPLEPHIAAVPRERMQKLAGLFQVPIEIVADFAPAAREITNSAGEREILELVARRPCTVDDISSGMGISRVEAEKHLDCMFALKRVKIVSSGGNIFYQAAGGT